LSEKDSEDLFSKLHEKISEKIVNNDYVDMRQLGEDWELLKKVYNENARGPSKQDILERVGFSK